MRKILIPHQKDLFSNYELDGLNEPVILNERFLSWVNTHPDMTGFAIPYDTHYIDYLSTTTDDVGVLIPGGHDIGTVPERDEFELRLIDVCLERDIPLFGICKGLQIVNNYLGGTLSRVEGHWQAHCERAAAHYVALDEGMFLNACVKRKIPVNSFHRWAIERPGQGIKVEGTDPETDVPECISLPGHPIAAVQWHPSYMRSHPVSQALLEMFYRMKPAA